MPGVARRHSRAAAATVAAAVLAAWLLSGCSGRTNSFVQRNGSSLQLDGKPFRFVGFNLYDAAASDIYSCSPATRRTDRQLASAFGYIRDRAGASVVRFWAYQTYTAGGTDFSGVDRVLHAAKAAGLRVIPVLEDGPGNCTTGRQGVAKNAVQGDTWYTNGYRAPYGSASLSYVDYVRIMARHYRDDPTILAWMMMNEAETHARDAQDHSALVAFAQNVGAVIRSVDAHHLITLGTQANGAFGASGRDFSDIYRLPVLDFAEVHDWAVYGSDTEPLPGSVSSRLPSADSPACTALDAKIACSFARAQALGKPLIVGEAGIGASDVSTRQRRAALLGAKIAAAFAAGADGYLVWHLSSGPTDGYDVVPSQHDPLFGVLHAASQQVG